MNTFFFFEHVIIRIFFCHKVSFFFFHYLLVVSGDYARSSRRRREPLQSSSTKRKTSNLLSKSFFGLIVWKVLHHGLCIFENLLSLFFFSSSKAIRVNPLSLVSLVPFCLLITFYVFYPDKRLFQDSVLKRNLTYARMISDMVNYLLWYVLIHSQGGCVEYWVHQRRKGPKRLSQVPAPLSGNPKLKKKVKKPRNLLRKRE